MEVQFLPSFRGLSDNRKTQKDNNMMFAVLCTCLYVLEDAE